MWVFALAEKLRKESSEERKLVSRSPQESRRRFISVWALVIRLLDIWLIYYIKTFNIFVISTKDLILTSSSGLLFKRLCIPMQ